MTCAGCCMPWSCLPRCLAQTINTARRRSLLRDCVASRFGSYDSALLDYDREPAKPPTDSAACLANLDLAFSRAHEVAPAEPARRRAAPFVSSLCRSAVVRRCAPSAACCVRCRLLLPPAAARGRTNSNSVAGVRACGLPLAHQAGGVLRLAGNVRLQRSRPEGHDQRKGRRVFGRTVRCLATLQRCCNMLQRCCSDAMLQQCNASTMLHRCNATLLQPRTDTTALLSATRCIGCNAATLHRLQVRLHARLRAPVPLAPVPLGQSHLAAGTSPCSTTRTSRAKRCLARTARAPRRSRPSSRRRWTGNARTRS